MHHGGWMRGLRAETITASLNEYRINAVGGSPPVTQMRFAEVFIRKLKKFSEFPSVNKWRLKLMRYLGGQ